VLNIGVQTPTEIRIIHRKDKLRQAIEIGENR